jgi:hypothetical protein
MKKEASLLFDKSINSLLLSIEHFNRPWDTGRVDAVLMLLDHAFEMLLKASILHKGGKIREKRAKQTIGFDACVRKALSDEDIKFLTEAQALTLQTINSFRDAAQHHIIDISENHLYIHAQAGLTLFRDICSNVMEMDLKDKLPIRVLPISTTPPTDFATLFDNEVSEIKKLLKPGKRRKIEVSAKLRALAILDASLKGERLQPSQRELQLIEKKSVQGKAGMKYFREWLQ